MADYVSRYTGAEIDAAIDKIRSGEISTNPNSMGFGIAYCTQPANIPGKIARWSSPDTKDVQPGTLFAVRFENGNSVTTSNGTITVNGVSAAKVTSAKTGLKGMHSCSAGEYTLYFCISHTEVLDLGPFPSTSGGGGTDISLGITNSAVGNVLLVGSVDTSGKPTSYTTKTVKVWDGSGSY